MDPWLTLVRMTEAGRLVDEDLEQVRRLVSSACVAQVEQPRSMVSSAIVDQLERGLGFAAAVAAVEELVALRHNRMLIAAGRRGVPGEDGTLGYARVARIFAFPVSAA